MSKPLTPYEAFRTGQFEQAHFHSVAEGISTGKKWAQGFITFRRFKYEFPITVNFQIPVEDLPVEEFPATVAPADLQIG